MGKRLDLTDIRFGRVIAQKPIGRQNSHVLWFYICDCGRTGKATANNLQTGKVRSCGCLAIEHGHSLKGKITPSYRSWHAMISRCTYEKSTFWYLYGGRGIRVCNRWLKFTNFLEDMGERPEHTTLDRIDPNKNYEPGNTRWADFKQQRENQRDERYRDPSSGKYAVRPV